MAWEGVGTGMILEADIPDSSLRQEFLNLGWPAPGAVAAAVSVTEAALRLMAALASVNRLRGFELDPARACTPCGDDRRNHPMTPARERLSTCKTAT